MCIFSLISRTVEKYGIRTSFHSRETIGNILFKATPENNTKLELKKRVIFYFPCELSEAVPVRNGKTACDPLR